jgi:hypothetical protein
MREQVGGPAIGVVTARTRIAKASDTHCVSDNTGATGLLSTRMQRILLDCPHPSSTPPPSSSNPLIGSPTAVHSAGTYPLRSQSEFYGHFKAHGETLTPDGLSVLTDPSSTKLRSVERDLSNFGQLRRGMLAEGSQTRQSLSQQHRRALSPPTVPYYLSSDERGQHTQQQHHIQQPLRSGPAPHFQPWSSLSSAATPARAPGAYCRDQEVTRMQAVAVPTHTHAGMQTPHTQHAESNGRGVTCSRELYPMRPHIPTGMC